MVMTDSKLEFLLGWLMSPALRIGVTSDVLQDWGTEPVLNAVTAFLHCLVIKKMVCVIAVQGPCLDRSAVFDCHANGLTSQASLA